MQNSGTKLVLALVSLAFLLGITSWWYRYEAAHRASQFWGPEASQLIAESENLEAITLNSDSGEGLATQFSAGKMTDLSHARGQAHLRHAFLSDSNYVWDSPLDAAAIKWRWCLRFFEGDGQALVMLSEDLKSIGKQGPTPDSIVGFSCEPMTASLAPYFEAVGLRAKPQAVDASTPVE